MTKMILKDKIALITGAGSGIGRAIAISLSQRECQLILTDIDEPSLRETEAHCLKSQISCRKLDVADPAAINSLQIEIASEYKQLDVLINNAGVAIGGTFEQTSEEDFEWLMNVNFYGVVRMCRAFLPLLHKSADARIVNLSSIYGIIAPSKQSAYAASKFAVRGFSQVLAHELEKTKIGVTVVHPGGVATAIAKNARLSKAMTEDELAKSRVKMQKALKLSPGAAGEKIVRAIENRKKRVLVGTDAKLASVLERIFPVGYWDVMRGKFPK